MRNSFKELALVIALALAAPTLVAADGFYVTAQAGHGQQAGDSEPFGNNIAADADFPGAFGAGDGAVGGLGVGYILDDHFRIEGRIGYRDHSFNERKIGTGERVGEEYVLNGSTESTSFSVEGFYDLSNGSALTPYVKAGVGVSANSYAARLGGAGVAAFDPFDGTADGYYDNYEDGDSTKLAWNVGFGSYADVTERLSVYTEYQFMSLGDAETGQDSFTDGFKIEGNSGHEVMLGLRVQF